MKMKKYIIFIIICLITVMGAIIFSKFEIEETVQEVGASIENTSKNDTSEYDSAQNKIDSNINNGKDNVSDVLNNKVEVDIKSITEEPEKQKNEILNNGVEEPKQNISNSKVDNSSSKNIAPTGNTKYYIKVNYQENAVTVYEKDDNNYYTVPVKAMVCSCGTATPKSGVYKTSKGYEWGYLEGGTFGRYSTKIVGGILFHSVPYISQSEDTLEYWEYDKLGTTASLGCVRLSIADCKWIFDNCEVGTQVEFYADSNPGPLGKPSAQKISDNERCRNWDPTDTSPNSPWNIADKQ